MNMRPERKCLFLFYLAPEFTMLAFTSALEVLRLANQVLGYETYKWQLVSDRGDPVIASCGISINVDISLAQAKELTSKGDRPRMVVVCAGRNVQIHRNRSIDHWLRSCRLRGIELGAVCTGAYLLGQAGVLRDKRCTIHWENFPAFSEQFPDALPSSQIYEVDNGIYTCAGGTASLEMMLHIVGQDFGSKAATEVCELAIVASVRDKSERQRLPFSLAQSVKNPALKSLVYAMEENLVETLPLGDLALRVGLSRRQIERLFRCEFDCSPARFYIRLRLERAKSLLEQTTMPVVDVAIACGFVSASHFSKMFRSVLGVSPHQTRKPKLPHWHEVRSEVVA
jgi:transcriptional regulator GlxA family with amidase domain